MARLARAARRWMSGIMQVSRLTLPKLFRNFLRRPSLNRLDGMLQLAFPFLQALTRFYTGSVPRG